jgi:probable F420-dependent oxidoreductase
MVTTPAPEDLTHYGLGGHYAATDATAAPVRTAKTRQTTIGLTLPHLGSGIGPEAIVNAARRAEALGYDNLWAVERLLYPTNPRSKYPATADGSLPVQYAQALTPLETLTYVAAHTERIGLGTSVLIMPLHNPVMLARQLATLDVLSSGRLRVGLGQGWSGDEIEAVGATMAGRAARADEFLQVLDAVWTTDPAEFSGAHFTLPRSILQPKPVQAPRPPIYMAAYAPSALERVGRSADGWMPSGVPLANIGPMMEQVRASARAAGRDTDALELLIFADGEILRRSPGPDRPDFVGTADEIRQDVAAARELGATEIIFMPGYATGDLDLARYMALLEQLRSLI